MRLFVETCTCTSVARVLPHSPLPAPPPCCQILAVDKHLTAHDWVLWMDCDSLFMSPDIRLEVLIASALAAAEHPDDVHAILSTDGAMLNTGAIDC